MDWRGISAAWSGNRYEPARGNVRRKSYTSTGLNERSTWGLGRPLASEEMSCGPTRVHRLISA